MRDYRALVPANLAATVMELKSRDRFHAKQGRSTARVVLHRSRPPAAGLFETAFSPALASTRRGTLRPRRASTRPPPPNGATSSECAPSGSTSPKSSPLGERIGPGNRAAKLSDDRRT